MNYVDPKSGYNFAENLAKRSRELRKALEVYGAVIWPVIVKEEDFQLVDGYCRYATLRAMDAKKTYAYFGTI